jgi:hypothetical protein
MALAVFDDGSGPMLYAGGLFTDVGAEADRGTQRGAREDGRPRSSRDHSDRGREPTTDDDRRQSRRRGVPAQQPARGDEPQGHDDAIRNIARLDRQTGEWISVGGGVDHAVIALTTFTDDNGHALYVGGTFQTVGNGQPIGSLARWDGENWSRVGDVALDGGVRAFATCDGEHGSELYVGGLFKSIGSEYFGGIARWDGRSWSTLGRGLVGAGPRTLAIVEERDGPALYAGGVFRRAGETTVANAARWDIRKQQWSGLGAGVNERVVHMAPFNDGSGEKLYIAGWFTIADERSILYLGSWDGRQWRQVGERGPDSVTRALAVMPDDRGYDVLYVGGGFRHVDDRPTDYVARLIGCHRSNGEEESDAARDDTDAHQDADDATHESHDASDPANGPPE